MAIRDSRGFHFEFPDGSLMGSCLFNDRAKVREGNIGEICATGGYKLLCNLFYDPLLPFSDLPGMNERPYLLGLQHAWCVSLFCRLLPSTVIQGFIGRGKTGLRHYTITGTRCAGLVDSMYQVQKYSGYMFVSTLSRTTNSDPLRKDTAWFSPTQGSRLASRI